jgi:exopolysaccharide biosynthesis predicted pyruvyltransferase EpsI
VNTGEAVVVAAEKTLGDVLNRWIPPGEAVALLNVATYTNVGDHAITLGELAHLRRSGNTLGYMSTLRDYSPDRLRERLGDGVILIQGGGNLGDLWPHHQRFRERVLADFPEARVVQLPQSIKFQSDESLERARRAFAGHPRFTLLVRDANALSFARQHFDCPVELCPDAAFALGPQSRRRDPDIDVLVLARTDHEASALLDFEATGSIDVVDWIEDSSRRFRALRVAGEQLGGTSRRVRPAFAIASPLVRYAYEALARDRLEFGLSLLSRGRAVITDRLHGHILCTLLGIPHVIRDTGYGKLAGFHATWTAGSPIVEVRDSPETAMEAAFELADRAARGSGENR